ncbi:MAG: alkylation response protein AidB-like acyl-CoA dehydrogenase [Candidatus Aldehydirespiratoraceae bacterium]|jgi:alkylation response protein AidB-like acyl-CoA dehydrogenase
MISNSAMSARYDVASFGCDPEIAARYVDEMSDLTEHEVRLEFESWFVEHWDPQRPLIEWRELLAGSGWAVPSWPIASHGRDLASWADKVIQDVLREQGAVGPPLGAGMNLAAPTLIAHASAELKGRMLLPTITGAVTWTQLFSEPGAGSDLAGLRTTAVRDGNDWIVNGQKVWNTSAHHADFAILIARTDWDIPKHAGMTYFVLPMQQPGVETRPILQMNRHSSFNEVFLTDARIPAANLVGAQGDGWRVARTTLMHERTYSTLRRPSFRPDAGRTLAEAAAESAEHFATYAWYPQRAGRADLVIRRAQNAGRTADPVVRQAIADLVSFQRASEWTAARARAARALGRTPGPEGSLGKLAASEVARRCGRLHSMISGASGMLTELDGDDDAAVIAEVLMSTPAQSIAGGTDEIQRNIIGENVLGLPRERSVGVDVPFRDVPR